jgi:hypoxanthine phosphoribosyltransferase
MMEGRSEQEETFGHFVPGLSVPHRTLANLRRIAEWVKQIAEQVDEAHFDDLVLIPVLKASQYFAGDVSRCLDTPHRWEYLRCRTSRGHNQQGNDKLWVEVNRELLDKDKLRGADLLVLDTFADSGRTALGLTSFFEHYRNELQHRSLSFAFLLERTSTNIRAQLPAHVKTYVGRQIDTERWLVGYGLDFNERLRNIPCLVELEYGEDYN